MSYRRERIGFRFLNLDRATSDQIRTHVADATVRPQHGRPGCYVVSFWLNRSEAYDWIEAAVRTYAIAEEDYGLFVSIVTESDSSIIEVPDYARALFRKVGGRIEFSFTVVGPDDASNDQA